MKKNGDIVWMECSTAPIKNRLGQIIGAVEIVRDVTSQMRLTEENSILKRSIVRQAEFKNIITRSKKIKSIFNLIEKVSPTDSSVFITGESGTGKELFARAIWAHSKRKDLPFIEINCNSIPEQLFESELFGHKKGAFTGAENCRKGIIESAHGGTIFIDEVGDIPLSFQVKLLRLLQEGTYRSVGDNELKKVDIRVIAATNVDIKKAVQDGAFREDLFFRLNVIPITLPPLRERKEDITLLANHFLHEFCNDFKRNITGIASETLKELANYPWPGNIRELQNTIEYMIHVTDDEKVINNSQLPPNIQNIDNSSSNYMSLSIEDYTKRTILNLEDDNTEEKIAQILGISRKSLWEKRKKWGLLKS